MTGKTAAPPVYPLPTTNSDRFSYQQVSLDVALEDLASRFILNIPEYERNSIERVGFQIENAHWYYEDFVREDNTSFPTCTLKRFYALLWKAVPLLRDWHPLYDEAFDRFMQYKQFVPVCGAILLNESCDKVVLVKGWKNSAGWGFPKGKINQNEPTIKCAIREVLEETGYDIRPVVNERDKIETSILSQNMTLYIVHPVPEDALFATRTRKEISKIEWYPTSELPGWTKSKLPGNKFFHIQPFIKELKRWISRRKRELQVQAYDQNVGVPDDGKRNKKSKKKPIVILRSTRQRNAAAAQDFSDSATEEEGEEVDIDSQTADETSSDQDDDLDGPSGEIQVRVRANNVETTTSIPLTTAGGEPTNVTLNTTIHGVTTQPAVYSSESFSGFVPLSDRSISESSQGTIKAGPFSTDQSASSIHDSDTPPFNPLELLRRHHSGLDPPRPQSAATSAINALTGPTTESREEVARRTKILLDSLTDDGPSSSTTSTSRHSTPPSMNAFVNRGTPPLFSSSPQNGMYRTPPPMHARNPSFTGLDPALLTSTSFNRNGPMPHLLHNMMGTPPLLPHLSNHHPYSPMGPLASSPYSLPPSGSHYRLPPSSSMDNAFPQINNPRPLYPSLSNLPPLAGPPLYRQPGNGPPPIPVVAPPRFIQPHMISTPGPYSNLPPGPSYPPNHHLPPPHPHHSHHQHSHPGADFGNDRTPRASLLQPAPLSSMSVGAGMLPGWTQGSSGPRHVPHAPQLLALFQQDESGDEGAASAWSG